LPHRQHSNIGGYKIDYILQDESSRIIPPAPFGRFLATAMH
jgi:hypothetical protein